MSAGPSLMHSPNSNPQIKVMIRSLALILLMTPLALHAEKSSPSVTTHFLTFAPASLPKELQPYYRNAGAAEPFAASASTLGVPILYTGPREFALHGSKEDLEKSSPPVATVTLPEKCDLVLIVCSRAADDKISLAAYNLDSGDLKPGDYRIFNFSKTLVSITLGEQTFELAADKDIYVRDPKWHEQPMAFPLQIATVTDGKAKQAYSSFLEHFPTRRNLMFLFDGNEQSGPITFVTFDAETVPRKAAAGKGSSTRRKR